MAIYFLPLGASLILGLLNLSSPSKLAKEFGIFFIAICCLFYCSGYMTGSDWRNYEKLYNVINWKIALSYPIEKGFYLYMQVAKVLGFAFYPFLILSKSFVFLAIVGGLWKITKYEYFSIFMFFGLNVLYVFVDNPLRFMLALGIVSFSYTYLLEGKAGSYFLVIILAISFHISAVIMLPVFFIRKIKMPRKVIIVSYLLFFIMVTPSAMILLFDMMLSRSPILKAALWYYVNRIDLEKYSLLGISNIFYLMLFIMIVINKKAIENEKSHGPLFFAMSFIWFLLYKLGSVMPTLFRLSIYLAPFLIASTIHALKAFKYKKFGILFIALFIMAFNYNDIYMSWTYYPYTNYFLSGSINELPFDYRTMYNKEIYRSRFGMYPKNRN
jgi:hypothetical protein